MIREKVYEHIKNTYNSIPEHLWVKYPDFAVFRHADNKKWFAIIMDVPKNKLGLDGTDKVNIINVKCDPNLAGSLRMEEGIFPAYHMNKEKWISVLLDGSVDEDTVYALIDISFRLTENNKK